MLSDSPALPATPHPTAELDRLYERAKVSQWNGAKVPTE